MKLNPDAPYDQQVIDWLDDYEPDLWRCLDHVRNLTESVAVSILAGLLQLACQSQNVRNITLGRQGILELPREWTRARTHEIATKTLDLEQEWEYLRLLEVYHELDHVLCANLIAIGLESDNEEIRESAQDFQE